jgi:hypothetical protein
MSWAEDEGYDGYDLSDIREQRMSASNWVHLDVDEIKRETDKAFLLVIDGDEHWIPKSQISEPDDYEVGDKNLTVSVTEWIAEQKELN